MAARGVEVEIKLPVRNARATRAALTRLGFTLAGRELERDVVLDTADLSLRGSRRLLRLRHHGGKWKLTYKGPPRENTVHKVRPEIETDVSDGERFLRIMEQLGYREVFRYEKRRSTYRQKTGSAVAAFDVTPIGDYIELEGPRAWIDRTARALGYSPADYITASYSMLYLQHCQRTGQAPTNMVFKPAAAGRGK